MTQIKIQKHNINKLKEYGDGSFNDIVCKLIEDVGEQMPDYAPMNTVSSSIRLHDDTLELLESFKVVPSESYESVIVRLLYVAQHLNNKSE